MKQIRCFLALLLILAARSGAQEHNSVPLDHPAYELISMGVMQGIIVAPPAAKPWSIHTIKEKLSEMLRVSSATVSAKQEEAMIVALDSLERKDGFAPIDGRYRTTGENSSFEAGLGWESGFSVGASPGASIATVNMAKIYAGGDIGDGVSWNVAAQGGFLYINREEGHTPSFSYSVFPYSFSKQWDGGVVSLKNPGLAAWPDNPSLAGAFEAELNGSFFDRRILLRLGRTRRDWGNLTSGDSLFLNAHARPFTAIEGTIVPLSWLNISFLGGALERFREDSWYHGETASFAESASKSPFTNMLLAGQMRFNPVRYFGMGIGGAAVLINKPNAAFFADLEVRVPGLFTVWGSFFLDRLNKSLTNFGKTNGNNYAYQAGIKVPVFWLPLSSIILRYTKIEPYCYAGERISSSFMSGGESLGYYMPPNSDELLLRFESMLIPDIKFHVQFQMMRHGADFGPKAVPGSSLYDTITNIPNQQKYFLKDGGYQWDNAIKLGASCNFKSSGVPILLYVETGVVFTYFTVNGEAGIGNEADHERLSDSEYRPGNRFIFSIGFRVFP